MIYSRVPQNIRTKSGVAILIDRKWKSRIESYAFMELNIHSINDKLGEYQRLCQKHVLRLDRSEVPELLTIFLRTKEENF